MCINQLQAAKTQREVYLGPWLPEPILTEAQPEIVSPLGETIKQESISIAFLVLLEALSPAERAVYLLREVFDYKYSKIAAILDKEVAACRQLFRRAKSHITAGRLRFTASPEEHERLLRSFIEVVDTGEIEAFLQLLAEDVTFVPDGGGQRGAAIQVLKGRDAVAQFIFGVQRIAPPDLRYRLLTLNVQQAILAQTASGQPCCALFIYSQGETAQLIHVIAGHKLAGLAGRLS